MLNANSGLIKLLLLMTRIVVKEYELLTLSKSCNGVGVEHVGGDMFDSVHKGDAIFMKVGLYDSSSPPQKKKKSL